MIETAIGKLRLLAASGLLATTAGAALQAQAPAGPADAQGRCAALAGAFGDGVAVTEAALEAAGPMRAAGGPDAQLPQHCRVRGVIGRRTGVGGREFGTRFELRLPSEWNGRFLFQGGAGLDGQVSPAIGRIANSAQAPALARGFAVVSTDAGHSGSMVDASFGVDQQARVDYAYAAIG